MEDKISELKDWYASAVKNQQEGKAEIAEELYKKILNQAPNHVNTQSNLGALYAQTGQTEKALDLLQSVVKNDSKHINANINLGVVFNRMAEYHKAIECHNRILKVDPNHADAYNNIAINYQQLGENDLAKSNFYKAIEIEPNHARAYNNLGILFGGLGEHEEATKLFKKALKIDPNFYGAQTNLSNTYINHPDKIELSINESYKALSLHHIASKVYSHSVPLFRLKHDVQQSEYLKLKGYKINGLNEFNEIGKEILSKNENNELNNDVSIKDSEAKAFLPFYKAQHIYDTNKILGDSLSSKNNWKKAEDDYVNSDNQIIYIDNFLSDEAIKELREFCLVSKVWIHQYDKKYLGAFAGSGFTSSLHLKIRKELQNKMPNLFGKYSSGKFWGFKYDTKLGDGIGIHADFANLNLNFWITPDEYNNDKNKGGIKVYDAPAPDSWSFHKYNSSAREIFAFLKEKKANCKTIPYKFNRAVLFNSAYFHETDDIDFKDGYESRRINVTYLFGARNVKKK
jgi:Tfp pilus assembly protein PilF